MSKYNVTYKTFDFSEDKEKVIKREFEDVRFREMYIRATDDDTTETFYIPYYKIYDIKYIKENGDL